MKRLVLLTIINLLLVTSVYGASLSGVINTGWIKDKSLKYGFLGMVCTRQVFTGLVESSKFNGHHIVKKDDYHLYRVAQDLTSIGSGYLFYATVRSKRIPFWTKVRRTAGVICLSRNCTEWAYRANRTGDMFNYGDFSHNRKALIYFKWDVPKGKFVDMYISGVGRQGVFIDVGFLLIGWWLFE